MKTLLSLDLGVTTGFAVFDGGSDWPKEYGDLPYEFFEEGLKSLILQHLPTHSVAERPVIYRGELGDKLQAVVSATERVLMRQVEMVGPAEWKQHPIAKSKCPPKCSPHTRDAIRLGRWYTLRLQGN